MTKAKRGVGRPEHQPTDETKAVVEALASYGVPQVDIGKYIGISNETIRKHYGDILDKALLDKNQTVAKFLFGGASGTDIDKGATYADCYRAAMFWMKTRAGWRETAQIDHTSGDGSMSPTRIELVAPQTDDNATD